MTRRPHEQWVWLETEPDGQQGMIVARLPELGGIWAPLAHRRKDIAQDHFGPYARQHAERTGRPVRLVLMREVIE